MGSNVATNTNSIVVRETIRDSSEPVRGDLYRVEIIKHGASGRPELHVLVGGEQRQSVITIEFTSDELRRLADIMVTAELRELRKLADKKKEDEFRVIPTSRPH